MSQPDSPSASPKFILLGSVCVVVAALYFAQEVLIPLALAGLLSFLLAPLVKRLEHLRLPRSAAVIVTVLIAFGFLFCVGWVVYDQLADLKSDMATYQAQVTKKIQHMREQGGVLNVLHSAGAEVNQVLHPPSTAPAKTTETPSIPAPAASDSIANESSPFAIIKPIGSFLLGPIGTAFVVTVFTIFMLVQREDLRDRLIRLVGRNRLTLTTRALDDAAERVSRYLLLQSVVNSSVGAFIFVLLWCVGKLNGHTFPAVALWGLMAALLRFVPYIGIWISSIIPLLLAIAIFPGARGAVETLFCYGGVEIITANVIEPMLFGSSTGIATLAVLVAAAFWTWLWGPVGLLLSTPLTVCLVVMGKYVPQLEFLTILLAEEPALAPHERVYQRLLATDIDEASVLVTDYAKKLPLEEVYDTVLVPALATAQQDSHRGSLTPEHLARIQRGIGNIADELRDHQRASVKKAPAKTDARSMLPTGCTINVVCLPASDESDQIAARMLAHLLEIRGYCVKVASINQLAGEMVQLVSDFKADLVCISALPPAAVTHARYLTKRLHSEISEMETVIGLWTDTSDMKRARDRIATVRPVRVVDSFAKALEEIHQVSQPKMINN